MLLVLYAQSFPDSYLYMVILFSLPVILNHAMSFQQISFLLALDKILLKLLVTKEL